MASFNEYQNIAKKLRKVEELFDVHLLQYGKLKVWPIVKYMLLSNALLKQSNNNISAVNEQTIENQIVNKKNRLIVFVLEMLNGIVGAVSLSWHISKFVGKYKKSDASNLFIDDFNNAYIDLVDGKKYSRYLLPYFEEINKRGGAMLLDFTAEDKIENKHFQSYYYNLNKYKNYYSFKQKIKKRFTKSNLSFEGLNDLNKKLKEIDFPSQINIIMLGYIISEIEMYKDIYTKIFQKIKPKTIFYENYYGNQKLAGLTLAAKEAGIKVIDIQHGVSFCVMYFGWWKVPVGGFELLPNNYWVWSKYDFENIYSSRMGSGHFLPILGGNLWYKKFMSSQKTSNDDNFLVNLTKEYKKVILITLDHSSEIATFLFDAIENGRKDWLWLARFHPHDYVDPGYRETYKTQFDKYQNVHYEISTRCDLFQLLKLVHYNISRFSSVCVEALSFRVPSILMSNMKIEQWSFFEKTGCFIYSTNSLEIIQIIENDKVKVTDKDYDYYRLMADDKDVDFALTKI